MPGEFDAGGLAVLAEIIGPAIMAVARDDDQVRAEPLRTLEEASAGGGIAAPIVIVEGQADLGRGDAVQDIVPRPFGCTGRDPARGLGGHHPLPPDPAE